MGMWACRGLTVSGNDKVQTITLRWNRGRKGHQRLKRSRELRSQAAGMSISVVNVTEIDERELCREAGTVALSERGCVI